MVQLIASEPLQPGHNTLKLASINDPGGYTVIGITDKVSSAYSDSIALAGNS